MGGGKHGGGMGVALEALLRKLDAGEEGKQGEEKMDSAKKSA